jgi:hypothetical protein
VTSLLLGSTYLHGGSTAAQVMAEGTSRGNPVPIEVAVKSWLQDGSIVVTQGHDNREVRVRVRFIQADLTALATLEAALFAELEKPNTLTWTPANGPASVFVVVTSSLEQEDDFLGEQSDDPWRTYSIRLVCEAFVRSASETVAAALAANGTTTTLVNDGSATTNWTGAVNGVSTTPTVSSGAIKVTNGSAVYGAVTVSATLTTSITTSSTKYLVVDWKPEMSSNGNSLRAFGDGVELSRAAETVSPTAGFIRTWFGPVAASSIAALRLDHLTSILSPVDGGYDGSAAAIRSLYIDNINRTDIKPSLGTARQLLRAVPIGGSARSGASLAVEHSTNALGDVLVYVYPNSAVAYSPPLRPYRVAGGATTTSDSTLVSGARDAINGATATFDVPVSQLVAGGHLLVVRAYSNILAAATLSWTASTRIGSTALGSTVSGSRACTSAEISGPAILALGKVVLPTVDASPSSASTVVRITITATSSGGVDLDEAWLFNTEIGALIGPVACGSGAAASGGPARRLFIEPPSISTPRPRLLIGHAADRSDAFYPAGALGGWQFPEFKPPSVNVLTVTTNALDASVTVRNFNRWHTHAAS